MIPRPDRPLLIASGNSHKHEEIRRALPQGLVDIVVPATVQKRIGEPIPDPVEDGTTLLENAVIKGVAFSTWSGLPAVADDTGLFIEALDGEPGVHSARWAGEDATFQDNVAMALDRLQQRTGAQRRAQFRCVLALCHGDELILSVEGTCPGTITEQAHGSDGFGYDPIFIPDGESLTFAEMAPQEKDAISHRGKALQLFCDLYQQMNSAGGQR